jgi:hypothetical protein
MCAEPPHDGKEWKEKFVMVYPYYGEKRYINEKRLLKNSHEKRFLMQYANRHFYFIPLSCHNKESFLKQIFLSLLSLEFDF